MSLLNKASLIQIPSGYKDGTLYSAKPTNGDGDFTFSRGSNLAATRTNSEGLIQKGRENLLLQSNSFDTTWVNVNTSETGGQSGYDGSSDAWLITLTGGTATKLITQTTSTLSGVYTASFYAKQGTHSIVQIGTSNQSNIFVCFDLSDGSVGSLSSNAINAKATSVGNGWYRIEVAFLGTNANGISIAGVDSISSTRFQATSSTGNFYIQDAQLELGLVSTDVITTTTTTAQAGILEDMPRLDYSGGATCGSLILEPQRSNLVTQSEYLGASSWTKQEMTIASNSGIAPDGTLSATKVIPTTASSTHQIETGNIISSTQCAFSVFAKADGYDRLVILDQAVASNGATFYLSTQTAVTIGTATATIEDYGNDWYRCTIVANTTGMRIYIPNSSSSISGDGTSGILIWGAQVEAGSYSTSYIPTYGSSVTRGNDFALISNASNLIGQTEGTMFIEFTRENNSVGTFSISANNVGTRIYIGTNATGLICQVRNGYAQQAYFSTAQTEGTKYKCAIAYATNDFVLYMNGTQIGTDTSGTVPACNTIRTDDAGGANLNQPLKQAILFPTRLSNDELADLTTL